jgi:hypothetical protein
MPSIIQRIRATIFEIGRGANDELDLVFRSNLANTPAFRREASSNELKLRSGGRSTFRRLEKLTATATGATSVSPAATDHNKIYLCNVSGGAITFNLPAPADGLIFHLKDIGGDAATNNITIVRNGSEKIDNAAASFVIDQAYAAVSIYSNGTDWFIIGKSLGYLSGTATAALTTGSGSATLNASVRTITWQRHGKIVYFGGRLDLSSVSSPSGFLRITGLPYSAAIDTAVSIAPIVGKSFDSQTQNLYAKVLASTNYITVEEFEDGDAVNGASVLLAGSAFIIGGCYIAS